MPLQTLFRLIGANLTHLCPAQRAHPSGTMQSGESGEGTRRRNRDTGADSVVF